MVAEVIRQINHSTAVDRAIRLEVGRWETDAYPGFHLEGPQAICDEVLKIEDCDILVGIFWTRFGTPTVSGETGTEHEIAKAVAAWRQYNRPQVMLFFNNKPPYLRTSSERRQWMQVAQYRENLSADGLFWDYADEVQFEHEFRQCFENFLRSRFPINQTARGEQQDHGTIPDPAIAPEHFITLAIHESIPKERWPAIIAAFSDLSNRYEGLVFEVKVMANTKESGGPNDA
jgi:hypothetical protein